MSKKEKNRKGQLAEFYIRLLFFVMLTVLVLAYTTYVLTPKYDYGICAMTNLYSQPRDSIDVLVVGSSLTYAGINTNVLCTQYGIAAYNLCSAEQPFWISYYVIREALKTQHPKVILLDAKPAMYIGDYSKHGRTILSTYGIRGLDNRIGAILACVKDQRDAWAYVMGFPQVHGNYSGVAGEDFLFPPDNAGRGDTWKGFIEIGGTVSFQRPFFEWTDRERMMNKREEEYARKIFELAQTEEIALVLISMPYPDYGNDHAYYNSLWRIAVEYDISGLNYNHPDYQYVMNYAYDFADQQHLNVRGSVSFSRRLGTDLKKHYVLPDHRGEETYASYDACAALWFLSYPAYSYLK